MGAETLGPLHLSQSSSSHEIHPSDPRPGRFEHKAGHEASQVRDPRLPGLEKTDQSLFPLPATVPLKPQDPPPLFQHPSLDLPSGPQKKGPLEGLSHVKGQKLPEGSGLGPQSHPDKFCHKRTEGRSLFRAHRADHSRRMVPEKAVPLPPRLAARLAAGVEKVRGRHQIFAFGGFDPEMTGGQGSHGAVFEKGRGPARVFGGHLPEKSAKEPPPLRKARFRTKEGRWGNGEEEDPVGGLSHQDLSGGAGLGQEEREAVGEEVMGGRMPPGKGTLPAGGEIPSETGRGETLPPSGHDGIGPSGSGRGRTGR